MRVLAFNSSPKMDKDDIFEVAKEAARLLEALDRNQNLMRFLASKS